MISSLVQSSIRMGARGTSSRYRSSRHAGASPMMRTGMEFAQYVTAVLPSVQVVNDCDSNSVSLYTRRHSKAAPRVGWKFLRKSCTSHGSVAAGSHPRSKRAKHTTEVRMGHQYPACSMLVKRAESVHWRHEGATDTLTVCITDALGVLADAHFSLIARAW